MKKQTAFTLIELLVVVAIIVILIAMLMPSLAKARAQAKSVQCLSNIKQMGSAFFMYAQENNDWLPPNYLSTRQEKVMGTGNGYSSDMRAYFEWSKGPVGMGHMAAYLGYKGDFRAAVLNSANMTGKRPKVFVCSSAPEYEFYSKTASGVYMGSSQYQNFIDYLYWRDSLNPALDDTGNRFSHFGLKLSFLGDRMLVYCMAAGGSGVRYPGGHMDGSNFLFGDGHAEYLRRTAYTAYSTVVWTWWEEDTRWRR